MNTIKPSKKFIKYCEKTFKKYLTDNNWKKYCKLKSK